MLSIDEAIALERQIAKEQRDHIGTFDDEYSKKCEVWAEEHEQIAEWLEELKAIKSDGFTDNLLNMGFTKGYNKAIDDFSHELKETFNLEIPLNYSSTKPFFTLENSRKLVDDLAERLKEQNK